jgi:heavy metal translocating P-type ATPase
MPEHTEKPACKLCGLPVVAAGDEFCCVGCRHVHAMLTEALGADDPATLREHPIYRQMQERGIIPRGPDDPPAPIIECPVPQSPPTDDEEEIVMRVDGMWCPSCSWVIEKVVDKIDGVQATTANFHSDTVKVRFKSHKVRGDQLARAVAELGYRVADDDEQAALLAARADWWRLGVSLFFAVNVMMLSFGMYGGFFVEVNEDLARLVGVPLWIFCSVVIFYSGRPILWRAYRAARAGGFVMETLISLGALSAYGLSVFNLIRGDLHQYFDTAAMLIALVLVGKHLEKGVRRGATRGIAEIHDLAPRKARLITPTGARFADIAAATPGARVLVLAGEPIPVDGRIVEGSGVVDEAKLTGENRPRRVGVGREVLAGALLSEGELTVEVTAGGAGSSLGRMVALMEEAITAKNPAERFADRLIAWFVPAVILIAVATGALLLWLGAGGEIALVRAVTVLVIACPCALGIAMPLAKVAAVSRGGRIGVLVTNADALEAAAGLDAVVIDKTGTATYGDYAVREILTEAADEAELLGRALALEAGSSHPIAEALRALGRERGVTFAPAGEIVETLGAGLAGQGGLIGGEAFLREAGLTVPEALAAASIRWAAAGDTAVLVGWDGAARGAVRLGDRLREDMAEAVRALQQAGVEVYLVSGDRPETTAFVAAQLGVDAHRGGVLPAEKVAIVQELRAAGKKVGMVGDGANDAAALAAADVGFATGDALTVTKHASDMVLLSFAGAKLTAALRLARVTVRTIRVNLALAFVYNVVALPLALFGWVNPILAVSAMLLSSLTVVTNSARIARAT